MIKVLVKISQAGYDAKVFNLYTDADGFETPIAEGVKKETLEAGVEFTVDANSKIIKIINVTPGCYKAVDVVITEPTQPS